MTCLGISPPQRWDARSAHPWPSPTSAHARPLLPPMEPPHRVIGDENQPPRIAERSSSLLVDPEPLPRDVSPRRLRRGLVRLGGLIAIAVVIVTLGPGLGGLRKRFAHAQPVWILIACAFEVLSVLAYVPAFRVVFCRRMSWATSYKIAVAEEGAGSLFPLGDAKLLGLARVFECRWQRCAG